MTSSTNSRHIRKFDGKRANPGDFFEYVLSIVPGIAQMCTMDSTWTTTPSCGCRMARKEILTEECGLSITLSSNESLIHHICKIFQPEQVSDYRCTCCGRHSSTEHPAVRQRFLRSLPWIMKISITAPLTSAAQPIWELALNGYDGFI